MKHNIYGTYKFEKVSYLSPLSSSTIDFVNDQMEDTKYTIQADLFKVESKEYTVEFSSPKYVKEKVQKDSSVLSSDIDTLICSDVDYQYTIYDKDGNKAKWRLICFFRLPMDCCLCRQYCRWFRNHYVYIQIVKVIRIIYIKRHRNNMKIIIKDCRGRFPCRPYTRLLVN